ncbi:MAG: type II toxin-antitoxin system RelE/ParE family toxin [Gemmatimonadaceae bacterium]|nr:type II toxin-antitoxin system RelE/ParE family toxin [Gemmatimonadaceae bacterium]
MAEIVWTEPAMADLDAIADYIAVESPRAASALVQRVIAHVEQLAAHPESGSRPQEFARGTRYRQLIEPPCRIFYRYDGLRVFVLHVMRSERKLRASRLRR